MNELIILVWTCGSLYLGYRFLKAFETWVDNERRREDKPSTWVSGATESEPNQKRKEVEIQKVPELAPEAIAPHLRNPPRPAGFGSVGDHSQPSQPDPVSTASSTSCQITKQKPGTPAPRPG